MAWAAVRAEAMPRYLVFHLDAVGARDLDRALDDGRLPNLATLFDGGSRTTAVTYFLASTPVVYPRMHNGLSNAEGTGIGFGGFDRGTNRPISEVGVFLELLGALPRRAVTSTIRGLPFLDWLEDLAMQNAPDLLERYRVVEFFWFSADTYGHLRGAHDHGTSLERFDAALGRLLPRLDLDGLNVILYSDHGMSFTNATVDVAQIVEDRVGEAHLHYTYPNLYLADAREAPAVARALTRAGGVDFAFYRVDDDVVEGYVDGSFVRFEAGDGGTRYLSEGDPLGYDTIGYDGAPWTDDEWLMATYSLRYPAVPPNVFGYVQNPNVGDVVLGLNPPRIPLTLRANAGNHAGIVDTDLVVRVLSRGPDVDHLAASPVLWLGALYRDLPDVRARPLPSRERHEFGVRFYATDLDPSAWVRYSPAYRLRLVGDARGSAWRAWAEADVFSTYLVRWWLGVGVVGDGDGTSPLVRTELQYDVGDVRLRLEGAYQVQGWRFAASVAFRVGGPLSIEWLAPGGVGLSVAW